MNPRPLMTQTKLKCLKCISLALFQPHSNISNADNINMVETFLDSPLLLILPVKSFTTKLCQILYTDISIEEISSFRPDFDLISADVTKYLPNKAVIHITHIFDSILKLFYFHLIWKFSTIILFPKLHEPLDRLTSYRLISLLPLFTKILERLIIKWEFIPNISLTSVKHILSDTRFGFHTSHSTTYNFIEMEYSIPWKNNILHISQAFNHI